MKKEKKKTKRRKLLKAWSLAIKEKHHCEVCGSDENLTAHHLLVKERYKEFKFDLNNGICLCCSCHKYGRYSFHRNSVWSTVWLQQNKPNQYKWVVEHMGEKIY